MARSGISMAFHSRKDPLVMRLCGGTQTRHIRRRILWLWRLIQPQRSETMTIIQSKSRASTVALLFGAALMCSVSAQAKNAGGIEVSDCVPGASNCKAGGNQGG